MQRIVGVVVERRVIDLAAHAANTGIIVLRRPARATAVPHCRPEGALCDAVCDAPDRGTEVGVLSQRRSLRAAGNGAVVERVVPAQHHVALRALFVGDDEVRESGAIWDKRSLHALLRAPSGRRRSQSPCVV